MLIAQLEGVEEYQNFVALVRDLIPEREVDIFHELTPADQVAAFATYFEDRYFPLEEMFKMGDIQGYYDLTRGIPLIARGVSWDDYHEMAEDWRAGLQLLTYLVQDPYQEPGSRIALAEACAEHVPAEVLQQVPEGGFTREKCKGLLDGTPYKGVVLWANTLYADTDNFFLDNCYEDVWNYPPIDWDRETVKNLTQQWQQADVITQEVFKLCDWLEDDLPARFEELLKFILERG
jgi:hypothetical protein